MGHVLDEALSEALLLHQEIIRYDAKLKLRIRSLQEVVNDENSLLRETRACRSLIDDIASRIDRLSLVPARLTSRSEKQSVVNHVNEHTRELDKSKEDLSEATRKTRSLIDKKNRSVLFHDNDSLLRRRKREEEEMNRQGEETGERLSLLKEKLASSEKQSEQDLINTERTSETINKTGSEYRSQGAFIQTSGKLMSKWERRELTDKILVFIALLFYLAALYYILHKRFLHKFVFW